MTMNEKRLVEKKTFIYYLILFCLLNLIVINGFEYFLENDGTQIGNIYRILICRPKYYDSWDPMISALNTFKMGDDPTIYQKVFFDQKQKFQYPPTSLLFIDGLQKLTGGMIPLRTCIDLLSGVAFWGTIIISVSLFLEVIKKELYVEKKTVTWIVGFLIGLLGLTYYPLNRAFFLGQVQIWLDLFFTLSLWFWIHNRQGYSGIFLGIISVIKPQMGIFLLWGFFRHRVKFCLGVIGVVFLTLSLSLLRYGLSPHLKYLEVLRYIGQRGETFYANQSVNGLINRLLFNGNNLHWDASKFAPENGIVSIVTIVSSIVFYAFAIFLTRKKDIQSPENPSWISFSIASLMFTLASPVAWEHHYGIFFPVFALAIPSIWKYRDLWKAGPVFVVIAYLLISNFFPFTNQLANTIFNFIQSYLLFGALIFLFILIKLFYLSLHVIPKEIPPKKNNND